MIVVKFEDVVSVLKDHLDTPEAAGIVYDLLDYMFVIADK